MKTKCVKALIALLTILFSGSCLMQAEAAKRVTLRKDKPFAEQLNRSNTIYCIKSDFDLNGGAVTIPQGSTLKFSGGILKNGKIVGTNTSIDANLVKVMDTSLQVGGTWKVNAVYPQWFGAVGDNITDDTEALVSMFNFPCKKKIIPAGDYSVKEIMSDGINNSIIYGYGATLHYSRYNLDELCGEQYGQILCNYTINSKPQLISHDRGDVTIYGLTIDGHRERFVYKEIANKITSLINHHAVRFICSGKIIIQECEIKNTFMTAVLCEGCDELIIKNCKVIHSGECEKYKPFGYHYTWEGVGLDDRCYLGGTIQTIPCSRCVVKNSYFEDIAGSYASANCKVFECYGNTVINNRGYLHELSTHAKHGSRYVNIHDNTIDKLGSSICMLNNFQIEDGSNNTIRFSNNTIKGYLDAGTRSIPSATQLWYENFTYGEEASGNCKTIISNNKIECSERSASGNMTFNSNCCVMKNNIISHYGNGKNNNQLVYLPRETVEKVYIRNNTIDGINAYLMLVNNCDKLIEIVGNKVTFMSQADALSSVIRANWNNKLNNCKVIIKDNNITGSQYLYSSGDNYNGKIIIEDNETDAIIGVYFNNFIESPVNCKFRNNTFKTKGAKITNSTQLFIE